MWARRLMEFGLGGATAALRRPQFRAQAKQVRNLRYIGFRKQPTTLERLTYFVGGVVVVGALVQEGVVFEEVVFTKRTRWMLNASPSVDITLGRDTLEDCLAEHGSYKKSIVPQEKQIQEVVEERFEILRKAAAPLDLAHLEWEVHVVDKDEANAFCLPGGKMCVYTGLLQFYADAYHSGRLKCHPLDALDAVLAHEMAHAICRHGVEKMKLLPFLSIFSDSVSGPLLHYLTDYIVSRPYSRALEEEADHVGMVILARACLDPSVVPDSLKALSKDQEEEWDELDTMLSTHPQGEVRKRLAMEKLPAVIEAHTPSVCVKPPSPSNKDLLGATREKKVGSDGGCSDCKPDRKDFVQDRDPKSQCWIDAWLAYQKKARK